MSERKFKCDFLNHALDFEVDTIRHCCQTSHLGGGETVFVEKFDGTNFDWVEIFNIKKELSSQMAAGNIPDKCVGCAYIEEVDEIDSEEYISSVWLNHFNKCNCFCSYCEKTIGCDEYGYVEEYDILPVFREMLDKKILRNGGHIIFGGGEPTILKGFEELLELCYQNDIQRYIVHSSGIKYSPALARGLKSKEIDLIISLDAGTPETYKKIKNIDCFSQVCENIKRYVQEAENNAMRVRSKFIIVPEINDSIEEIDKWYNLSINELGVKTLTIDIEKTWFVKNRDCLPEYIVEMIRHVRDLCQRDGIKLFYYEQALLIENLI